VKTPLGSGQKADGEKIGASRENAFFRKSFA